MPEHELTFATMGHPQHGKSSVMGRLAIEFRGREHLKPLLAAVEAKVKQLGRPELRYSLVFDLPKQDFSLRENELRRDPSKTTSRLPGWLGCRVGQRHVMLVDEPGHTQFLRYIVAPAASTDVGIFVVDARVFCDEYDRTVALYGETCFRSRVRTKHGEIPLLLQMERDEQNRIIKKLRREKSVSRRPPWIPRLCTNLLNYVALAELFGIRRIIVAVHKLDQVDFSREIFEGARRRFLAMTEFLTKNTELDFVPTAVVAETETEHNVVAPSAKMGWYDGPTLSQVLKDAAKQLARPPRPDGPLRMQVERVAEASTRSGKSIPLRVFGRVDSGTVSRGDDVVFTPANVSACVKEIRLRDESRFYSTEPYWSSDSWETASADAGSFVSVAIGGKEIEAAHGRATSRVHWQGQLMSHPHQRPAVSNRLRARLMIVPPWWLEELSDDETSAGFSLIYGYERCTCVLDSWRPGQGELWWQAMTAEINCDRSIAMDAFRAGGALGKIILVREGFFVAGGTVIDILDGASTPPSVATLGGG